MAKVVKRTIEDSNGQKVIQDGDGKATQVVVDGKTYNVSELKKK